MIISDSVFLRGFVPMIGQGWKRSAPLDAQKLVRLYWDAGTIDDLSLPDLLRNSRDALAIEESESDGQRSPVRRRFSGPAMHRMEQGQNQARLLTTTAHHHL